ncbi:hypothetical protein OIU77_026789 [Salix suchowensis]|uniref:Protein kinase domain-containing protein n=1 Tax=Salix suchowensis TaxID=1278906 RepID=A0ABQ9BMQ5_9ROSI|nr:hypothetical protein OIU77_026789 [Salix suchowensis]
MLAGLRHRNLMSLRAYVREPDRFSLVYDYVPTGSLEDAMNRVRENELQLGWEFRLRIAVGVIKGLRATSGYSAPECFQDCRYSDKSDVFSFGVILGVLLTGRDPTDPFFGETASGGSLGHWLRHLQQAGEAREALDKSLLGEEVEEDEMLMAVRIAVVCQSDMPADRPSSDELFTWTQLFSQIGKEVLMWSPMIYFFLWFPPILEFASSADYHIVVYSAVTKDRQLVDDHEPLNFTATNRKSVEWLYYHQLEVGSSGKQLVPLKRGLGFKSPCTQQHPLVASPATARHATRGDHQISRGNPDTGGWQLKWLYYQKHFLNPE